MLKAGTEPIGARDKCNVTFNGLDIDFIEKKIFLKKCDHVIVHLCFVCFCFVFKALYSAMLRKQSTQYVYNK